MAVIVTIPKEPAGESRVAMTPTLATRLVKLGLTLKVQHDAGQGIFAADALYKNVDVLNNTHDVFNAGDIIIKVVPPTDAEINNMKDKAILISYLYPHTNPALVKKLQSKNITCFAMEMIPRISRAQDMDVLSSQATIAGYKAVIIAADSSKFFFPMLSTAAGSIKPAKVLIIGAGVAGLQAIATAKRLGAIVEAYDVREETREQVESLGAKFVKTTIKAEGTGGYARELSADEQREQQELLAKHIAASDVVITTAGVPGKQAPKIISQAMVNNMKPGSIIVDIMAENGGNCELTKANETINHNNVTIIGAVNLPSMLAINASEMYARNIINFLNLIIKDGAINLDWNDEIIAGCAITHEGKITNQHVRELLEKM
jgi:H+-translocating NAD(P) transhydrogenase subunit alpha